MSKALFCDYCGNETEKNYHRGGFSARIITENVRVHNSESLPPIFVEAGPDDYAARKEQSDLWIRVGFGNYWGNREGFDLCRDCAMSALRKAMEYWETHG